MYKWLSVSLLVVVIGLVVTHSTGFASSGSTSATIVKRIALNNLSQPIPTTTIFPPGTSGLFRISVYIVQVVPSQNQQIQQVWTYHLNWQDSAGAESTLQVAGLVQGYSLNTPPTAWARPYYDYGTPGNVSVFQAVAGQPVTYSVSADGLGDGGEYSLAFVIERLI